MHTPPYISGPLVSHPPQGAVSKEGFPRFPADYWLASLPLEPMEAMQVQTLWLRT